MTLEATIGSLQHAGPIRGLQLSDNDTYLASHSIDCVKIWNGENGQSLKTIAQDNIVSVQFLPLNKHIVLGSKYGKLYLFHIPSNECI